MKIKAHLLALSALVMVLCTISCKKDSDHNPEHNPIKVRYEVTTNMSFVNLLQVNSLVYSTGYFNFETVSVINGNSWSKEVTIQEPQKTGSVSVGGMVQVKGINGTVTARIYIDGVKKVETNQEIPETDNGYPLIMVNANYVF